MKIKTQMSFFQRLFKPAGDDGSDTGGTGVVDRGDDFIPDDDDLDPDDPDANAKPDAKSDAKPEAKVEEADAKEADDKEAGEKEAEDKPKAKVKKGEAIPLDRHKQILEREREARKELETKLANFEKGTRVADINADLSKKEDQVLELEKQYNKLLADGELEKATDLMTKIRRAEREISDARVEMRIQAATAQATEAARYNLALERIEEAYPQLNPDSDELDNELLTDVADMKTMFESRGLTPTQALQRAVKRILGAATAKQETVLDTNPRVSEKDVAAERRKQAVSRGVDAARRTPPSTAAVGADSDKMGMSLKPVDVMKMSQEEFMKLDEKQLAALRGDAG